MVSLNSIFSPYGKLAIIQIYENALKLYRFCTDSVSLEKIPLRRETRVKSE